jgi:hypothetical protein
MGPLDSSGPKRAAKKRRLGDGARPSGDSAKGDAPDSRLAAHGARAALRCSAAEPPSGRRPPCSPTAAC